MAQAEAKSPVDGGAVGRAVRSERRKKGLSVREAAALIGITPSHLSQIERGVTNPSLTVLRKTADALGIPLTTFFTHSLGPEQVVVRAQRRPQLRLPGSEVVYELLSPRIQSQVELCRVTIEPGGETVSEPMSHGGEETALVLRGRMRLYMGRAEVELSNGDSVYIPPHVPHRWVNVGTEQAEIVFAVSPPMF